MKTPGDTKSLLDHFDSWSTYNQMWAFSHLGDKSAITELIDELRNRADKEYILPFNMALAYAWLNDLGTSNAYLQKPMMTGSQSWRLLRHGRMFLIILKMIPVAGR